MALKTKIYVAPDGTHTIDSNEDPKTTDVVIMSYDDGTLELGAPVEGEISTEAQRRTVSNLAADWLSKRKLRVGGTKGPFDVKATRKQEGSYMVPTLTIKAPSGSATNEQLHEVSGQMLAWLNATGTKSTTAKPAQAASAATQAKKDDPAPAPAPKKDNPAPAPAPAPAPKKDNPAPAPAPAPKKDEPAAAPKKDDPAAAPKKDDPAQAPAPAPAPKKDDPAPAPAPAPAPKKYPDLTWDPKKSIDENLDAIMGPAD